MIPAELRQQILAEAQSQLAAPIRNISTQQRRILVGVQSEVNPADISLIVQFCGQLQELNSSTTLAQLIQEVRHERSQTGLAPTEPHLDWCDVSLRVVDRHKEITDPSTHTLVRRFIPLVGHMMGPDFKWGLESDKGEINLESDPGTPYKVASVCPVSGIIKNWVKTYTEAVELL